MRGKAGILYFPEKSRIVCAVERPAIEEEREQELPPPGVPLACKEFLLFFEILKRQQPIDASPVVDRELHHCHHRRYESLTDAAVENTAADQRFVAIPVLHGLIREVRAQHRVGARTPASGSRCDSEKAHELRIYQPAQRDHLELDQMILRRVEINSDNLFRSRCEKREGSASPRADHDDACVGQRRERFYLEERIFPDLREEQPIVLRAGKNGSGYRSVCSRGTLVTHVRRRHRRRHAANLQPYSAETAVYMRSSAIA